MLCLDDILPADSQGLWCLCALCGVHIVVYVSGDASPQEHNGGCAPAGLVWSDYLKTFVVRTKETTNHGIKEMITPV